MNQNIKNPLATILMENGKTIKIELYPLEAPNTVNSFIYLAMKGCFNQYAIQRIVPGYVVDASYSAFGKDICKYLITNESLSHGFPNHIKMEPGVIAMGGYEEGIAGGEFFFPLAYHEKLDGNYPVFGKILEGFKEVKRWEQAELRRGAYPHNPNVEVFVPVTPIIIKEIVIETFGVSYPEPVKLDKVPLPLNWE